MKFVLGEEVIMSETGKRAYSSPYDICNPHDLIGKIVEVRDGRGPKAFGYRVIWSNDIGNSYREIDLDFHNTIKMEDLF